MKMVIFSKKPDSYVLLATEIIYMVENTTIQLLSYIAQNGMMAWTDILVSIYG